MLLSFSHEQMRPWIEAGLRQYAGENVGRQRVKRQTIRKMGPRYERLLASADESDKVQSELHIWWKSRTPARRAIGIVAQFRIRSIVIERELDQENEKQYLTARVAHEEGPAAAWCMRIPPWVNRPLQDYSNRFAKLVYADGFDSFEAFADFFVPNVGDAFRGVLLQW